MEKSNRELDIITGFSLIDKEKRMYVFEGLSKGAMKKIEKLIPKNHPNSKKITILKNRAIKF